MNSLSDWTARWMEWYTGGKFDAFPETELQEYIQYSLIQIMELNKCDCGYFRMPRNCIDTGGRDHCFISGLLRMRRHGVPVPELAPESNRHPTAAHTVKTFELPCCYFPGQELFGRLYMYSVKRHGWCALTIPDSQGRISIEGSAWSPRPADALCRG